MSAHTGPGLRLRWKIPRCHTEPAGSSKMRS